jgi:hypothetical protein
MDVDEIAPVASAEAPASTSASGSAGLPAQAEPSTSSSTAAVAAPVKPRTNGSTQQPQLKRKMVEETEDEEWPKLAADTASTSRAAQMKQRRRESKYIKAGDLVIIFIVSTARPCVGIPAPLVADQLRLHLSSSSLAIGPSPH